MLASQATPPQRGDSAMPFSAVQSEGLYRSGLLREAYDVLQNPDQPTGKQSLFETITARAAIAAGQSDAGCRSAKKLVRALGSIPTSLRPTAALMIGYCAVHDNNQAAAGLAADLADDNGARGAQGVAALRAFSVGTKPRLKPNAGLTLMDLQIVTKAGGNIAPTHLSGAKPPVLAAVALNRSLPGNVRVEAAEAALKHNAISERDLSDIYRGVAGRARTASTQPDAGAGIGDAIQRSALYLNVERDENPLRRARNIHAYLQSARRAGFYWHALKLMAVPTNELALLPEIGWFAETGIETSLAAGDYTSARRWATFAAAQRRNQGPNLDHWNGLIAIADPGPSYERMQPGLQEIEDSARRGLYSPEQLHRLATVLDALDAHVPIPLWEMASRTPQPTTGHLPKTGVLSALKDAAKQKQFGRLILLTMQTLGADGTEGAHMIALGDSIRGLKRAGLKLEARQLAVEALFGSWPRTVRY